jgi:hypothetical protein
VAKITRCQTVSREIRRRPEIMPDPVGEAGCFARIESFFQLHSTKTNLHALEKFKGYSVTIFEGDNKAFLFTVMVAKGEMYLEIWRGLVKMEGKLVCGLQGHR